MILNKTTVVSLPSPDSGYQIYGDEKLAGFGVRVTPSGAKSFIFQKRIHGKEKRITLGRFGELTAELARKEAVKLAGKIASGIDPIAEKKESELKAVTLTTVFADYLSTRKDFKPTTLKDYHRVIDKAFDDWRTKPLLSITKDMVKKRHTRLGEQYGESWANLTMRLLRALFNFAAGEYEDANGRSLIAENPVKRLSQSRAWYRTTRRTTLIEKHQLKAWFSAVMDLQNETLRDYLLLIIMSGLRRNEAATLRWVDVNLNNKTLIVRCT